MTEGSRTVEGGSEAGGVETSAGDLVVPAGDAAISDGMPTPARSGRLARWGQRGMVSAEWAVGLIAAIAIAGVLIAIVTNGAVKEALLDFILMVIKAFSTYLGQR